MQIHDLLTLIKVRDFHPGIEERRRLLGLGAILTNDRFKDQIDRSSLQTLVNNLELGLQCTSEFLQILCASILFKLSQEIRYLAEIEEKVFNYQESIAYDVANLNAITSLQFNAPSEVRGQLSTIFTRNVQRILFIQIIEKLEKVKNLHRLPAIQTEKANSRVLILIQQFLRPPHAPTKDALEFARFFIQKHSKEVMILNTCEFNSTPTGAFAPPFCANVIADYSKLKSIDYMNCDIHFFQPRNTGFDDADILWNTIF